MVYRKLGDNPLFYVLSATQSNIVRIYHDDVYYVGIDKTYELIRCTMYLLVSKMYFLLLRINDGNIYRILIRMTNHFIPYIIV